MHVFPRLGLTALVADYMSVAGALRFISSGEAPAPGTGQRSRGPRSKYFPHSSTREAARHARNMARAAAKLSPAT